MFDLSPSTPGHKDDVTSLAAGSAYMWTWSHSQAIQLNSRCPRSTWRISPAFFGFFHNGLALCPRGPVRGIQAVKQNSNWSWRRARCAISDHRVQMAKQSPQTTLNQSVYCVRTLWWSDFSLGECPLMNRSYLHLKICEGCGRLWLRSHTITAVYCRLCTLLFADFPAPHSRRLKGRPCKAKHATTMVNSKGGSLWAPPFLYLRYMLRCHIAREALYPD